MRVDEAATIPAAKAGARYKGVGVRECVTRESLLVTDSSAMRATKLAIERFKSVGRRSELVGVPLNKFPCDHGVHLFEGHSPTLQH
jgi:hypothetical protein